MLRTEVPDAEHFPEQVAADVLRGHLDLVSPATAPELETHTGLRSTLAAVALAQLEAEGFVIQGHFRDPDSVDVEWCSRRLLARMHSYSRKRRRSSVTSASPQDFVRFLLRWQHLAPGTQLHGAGGLARVIEKLQGFHAAAAAWEPNLLAPRIGGYDPAWLDRFCHDGQVVWLRLGARATDDPDRRGSGPSKATPISVVFRDDLSWLLQAVRGDNPIAPPSVGATAEVVDVLRSRGARFLPELAADTGRLRTDVETALWDGVARGLVTADGFESIRALVAGTRSNRRRERPLSRIRRGVGASGQAAGRWQLIDDPAPVDDHHAFVEAVAEQLLVRWGVVFYDLCAHENLALPWRDLQWALRRFEDRGVVKGGRFVAGFSGEQFALPEAVDGLRATRKQPKNGERVRVNACDPCNITGVITHGERVPAVRTNTVTFVDGVPEPHG
ncbi:MAG: hypothetical protein OEU32_17965 [Acidimicrobiia bacterium]|nr:hypothetical protein [Acidimicrobiia bacterium]